MTDSRFKGKLILRRHETHIVWKYIHTHAVHDVRVDVTQRPLKDVVAGRFEGFCTMQSRRQLPVYVYSHKSKPVTKSED